MSCPLALLYVVDKSTAFAALVSLFSLKASCNPTQKYHVHILSVALTLEQEEIFKALVEDFLLIDVYSVDSEQGSTHAQDVCGILRLQLANIFWEIDKALYLDAHTLVQQDVQSLFALDMTQHHAALPVFQGQHASHVMLLNFASMRQEKVVAELMACNVAKGDFAGYGQALVQVLAPRALSMDASLVSHISHISHSGGQGEVNRVQPHAHLLCFLDDPTHNALWQSHVTQLLASHDAAAGLLPTP